MKYTTAILLTAFLLFFGKTQAQEIPFELQREIIRMNNDLNHFKSENKSLNVLIKEYKENLNQKDSLIENQSIIILNKEAINTILNGEVIALNNELQNEVKQRKFFKATMFGSLGLIPVALAGGFILSRSVVIMP